MNTQTVNTFQLESRYISANSKQKTNVFHESTLSILKYLY